MNSVMFKMKSFKERLTLIVEFSRVQFFSFSGLMNIISDSFHFILKKNIDFRSTKKVTDSFLSLLMNLIQVLS